MVEVFVRGKEYGFELLCVFEQSVIGRPLLWRAARIDNLVSA